MLKNFLKIEKKIENPSEQMLEDIKNKLFPSLELHEEMQADGTIVKFHVDYSLDSNLDAVLMDLEDGHNDEATHKTVRNVISKLIEIRKILEVYPSINEDAKYIIVDCKENEQ